MRDPLAGVRAYQVGASGLIEAVGHLSECASHQGNDYDEGYRDRRCTCLDWFPE